MHHDQLGMAINYRVLCCLNDSTRHGDRIEIDHDDWNDLLDVLRPTVGFLSVTPWDETEPADA